MYKIINLFLVIAVILFFFNTHRYYSSDKNIKSINQNRSNTDIILKSKISNIPILKNDTDNIIEFNSSVIYGINGANSLSNVLKI